MQRSILYILLSFFSVSLCAQELIPLNHRLAPADKNETALYFLESKLIDSTNFSIKIFYSDMQLLMTGYATDNTGQQLTGASAWYYKNGSLQAEGDYTNGQKTGTWKRYNVDGSPKADRHYSDVNMNNIIFNSALKMPKANGDFENFESFIIDEVIKDRAFDIVALSPIKIQFVVSKIGRVQDIKFDDRLSNHEMSVLDEIIKRIPSWRPGSNGTQNINVRVNYSIEFPKS